MVDLDAVNGSAGRITIGITEERNYRGRWLNGRAFPTGKESSSILHCPQILNENIMADLAKNNIIQLKGMLNAESTRKRFFEILGNKSAGFISSIINVVNGNPALQEANPNTILMSAAIAATLDLPINPNLGFAAIVPYKEKEQLVAQFQMMWRGFVQLAQRSGQYRTLNTTEVYEGEIKSQNRFTGEIEFDPNGRKSDNIVGYVAYMNLLNGFEKYFYMSKEDCEKHAKRYSKTYQKGYGKWKEDFDAMARKTVLKLLISKYGIMSVDMQKAVEFDQTIVQGDINHIEEATPEYIDNEQQPIEVHEPTEEQMKNNFEKVKSDPKAAEIALAKGEITLDMFNEIIDSNI